jgi:hypothetical protein
MIKPRPQQEKIPAPDTSPLAPPRETPTESPFTSWLGSLFTPPASATVPPLAEPDGINWGAGALAAMAGMSAYYLSKRREEEEAQRRAVREQVAAKNDALRAKEAQMREQAKIENYLQGKAMLEAQLAQSGLSDAEKAEIRDRLKAEGVASAMGLTTEKAIAQHEREAQAQQAKRESELAWLLQADKSESQRHAEYVNSDEYKARQASLLAWHQEQEKKKQAELAVTQGKGPGLAASVAYLSGDNPPNYPPWDPRGWPIVGPLLEKLFGRPASPETPTPLPDPVVGITPLAPTSTPIPFNVAGERVANFVQELFEKSTLPTVDRVKFYDGVPNNTNCTLFTNSIYYLQGLGLSNLLPTDPSFGRTPASQQLYSAQNGEIRFILNPKISPLNVSQEDIIKAFEQAGESALVRGSVIYTERVEVFPNTKGFNAINDLNLFGHSVIYMGNGQVAEMSGPSYWAKNSNGQYIGELVKNTIYPYEYLWRPSPTDSIAMRSLFDITTPSETLIAGDPTTPFTQDYIVKGVTTAFSIVPAQPVTSADLPNYGIHNFDQAAWETPSLNPDWFAGDTTKTCYLNPDTKNSILQQYYCPPTVPPTP